jgi:WD40 repeat protein
VEPAATPIWVATYGDAHGHDDFARSEAVSPDGSTEFVTGVFNREYGTAAYDAASGARRWVAQFNGDGSPGGHDFACCIAVSPDGDRVFVTGFVTGGPTHHDFGTIAYDAATGAELWVTRYDGGKHGREEAYGLALSPDGSTVYVGGTARGRYRIVAYDGRSGALRWASRRKLFGAPNSLKASPDGREVFAAGYGKVLMVACDAGTGSVLWERRPKVPFSMVARDIVTSPDSGTVFVTGEKLHVGRWVYFTVAYRARTGTRLWSKSYVGPAAGGSVAAALALSPDGSRVFVTGGSDGTGTAEDFATIAYDARTGRIVWARRYNGPANAVDYATAIAVNPDGSAVYVTGPSTGAATNWDYTTIAYDSATGHGVWLGRYDGAGNGVDFPTTVAVSPDGANLFVTGGSFTTPNDWDYTTLGYAT